MIRKIFLAALIFLAIFSCSRNIIVEDIIEQYKDGKSKVVHYYQEKKSGERVWIKETWFYQEGMKHLEGPIVNGKRHGYFKSYYKSGSVLSEGNFVDGKRDGKATVYYENGKVNYEGFYKGGRECGIWKFYDEEGNMYNEVNRDSQ